MSAAQSLATLLQSDGSMGSARPVDRVLGATTTIALGLALFRFLSHRVRHDSQEDGRSGGKAGGFMRALLRGSGRRRKRLLLNKETVDTNDETLQEVVMHRGGCHCKAIEFELLAPKLIQAKVGTGKIQFPHYKTDASNFRLKKGTDICKMYYVSVTPKPRGATEPTIAAHSFCSQCGVHVLHAPDSHSSQLNVNVNLLHNFDEKLIILEEERKNLLAEGTPVVGQFDRAEEQQKPRRRRMAPVLKEESSSDDEVDDQFNQAVIDPGRPPRAPRHYHGGMKPVNFITPGTPSTEATTNTESELAAASSRMRSFAYEQHVMDTASFGDDSLGSTLTGAASLPATATPTGVNRRGGPPPFQPLELPTAALPGTDSASVATGNASATTSPQMRDQLKYYMSKHLKNKQRA